MPDRAFAAIRRKLESWEIDHLRTLVAQQRDRIERLEDEVDILQQNAEFWERHAHNLMREKEAQILILMPNTTILPGYEAGVMAGYNKARAAVMNTLESL